MTDKERIRKEVERLQNELIQEREKGYGSDADDACILELQNVLTYIDSLQEESVSEELEEVANKYGKETFVNECMENGVCDKYDLADAFKAGAKWGINREKAEIQAQSMALAHGCPKEHISEELEAAAYSFACKCHPLKTNYGETSPNPEVKDAVAYGAKWQKQQMMAKAIDVEVKIDAGGYPYIPAVELYDYDNDVPLAKERDKYKVILIKEDLI